MLREAERLGAETRSLVREHNITERTFYRCRNEYGGMDVSSFLVIYLFTLAPSDFPRQPSISMGDGRVRPLRSASFFPVNSTTC